MMYFRYSPKNKPSHDLRSNQVMAIVLTLWGNVILALFLAFVGHMLFISRFPEAFCPLAIFGFLLFGLAGWNFQTFSTVLRQADLELTDEHLIIHLSHRWELRINLGDMRSVRIQEYADPRIFQALIGHRVHTFFISSPDLPWFLHSVGLFAHNSFKGRGFFITSQHENYEAFLDRMRQVRPWSGSAKVSDN